MPSDGVLSADNRNVKSKRLSDGLSAAGGENSIQRRSDIDKKADAVEYFELFLIQKKQNLSPDNHFKLGYWILAIGY